ncbi:MAG: hypothetical protein GC131_02400 [Alphaproteobacteria bacterium]|nr:hypothetical protein [Alphaproteobacteria bacterium]
MLGFYDGAAWGVIIGLALMIIGGLVIWAYGARRFQQTTPALNSDNPEAEATRRFHSRLSRAFFMYGISAIIAGLALFAFAGRHFL